MKSDVLFGDVGSLPSNLSNPFNSDKVESITVSSYKSIVTKRFEIWGRVEFKNGSTEGCQKFKGDTIMDVVQQIYRFLEELCGKH